MRFINRLILFAVMAVAATAQLLPSISLSPQAAAADGGELRLTIRGVHLKPSFQVIWNGQPRVTAFVDSRTLKAVISAADQSAPGLVAVSLRDSASGATVSETVWFLIYLPLSANDIVYDSQRALIYVALSPRDADGPSIGLIDPQQGFVQRYIPMPSEPKVLAVSGDSKYLYVALSDRVRRVDLTGASTDLDIFVTSFPGFSGTTANVVALAPFPSQNSSIAIALGSGQEFVVDGAQPRPGYVNLGSPCLVVAPDSTKIFGAMLGLYGELAIYNLTSSGFSSFAPQQEFPAMMSGPSCPVFVNGLLYDSVGNIVDPSVPRQTGRLGAWGLVQTAGTSTYFVGYDSMPPIVLNGPIRLFEFDNGTLQQRLSIILPVNIGGFTGGKLIHWGSDGLAFLEFPSINGAAGEPATRLHLFHVPAN